MNTATKSRGCDGETADFVAPERFIIESPLSRNIFGRERGPRLSEKRKTRRRNIGGPKREAVRALAYSAGMTSVKMWHPRCRILTHDSIPPRSPKAPRRRGEWRGRGFVVTPARGSSGGV